MKSKNIQTGKKGEQIAEKYLIEKGMKLIKRNYRYDRAEIDLIMLDKDELVFVEVKTRNSDNFGSPVYSITKRKLAQIAKASEQFIAEYENKISFKSARIDVVSILIQKGNTEIEHIENAVIF